MNPAGMFNRSVTIRAWVRGKSAGTNAPSYTETPDLDQVVQCAIQPRSSSKGIEFQKLTAKRQAVGFFPIGAPILHYYRVIDGATTWRVEGPARDVGGRGVYQECDLEAEDA